MKIPFVYHKREQDCSKTGFNWDRDENTSWMISFNIKGRFRIYLRRRSDLIYNAQKSRRYIFEIGYMSKRAKLRSEMWDKGIIPDIKVKKYITTHLKIVY